MFISAPVIAGKNISGEILVFRDITKEKQNECTKSEFIDFSHELLNSLTSIEWTVELLLKKEKISEEGKTYLHNIIYSAKKLIDLVKLFLNTFGIQSQKSNPDKN